jgi:hypothetical protein
MNTKQISSTIGICLAFIAVLSMMALPGLAEAQTRATTSHSVTWRCPCGRTTFTLNVEGTYNPPDYDHFVSGRTWYSSTGSVTIVSAKYEVISDTIVYAEIVVRCNYCGATVRITCWVSPPTFTYKYGDSITPW